MKKFIFISILLTSFCKADYTVTGYGSNKGDAYVSAMAKAPSGQHWVLNRIYYSPSQQECTIIWKINK